MNKVLIITYYWPPSGGAGVQRWLKFSKYLPEFGWEPVILTVDPEFAAYPVIDNSRTNDVLTHTRVYKTKAINYFSIYRRDPSLIPAAGFAISVNNTLKSKLFRFIRGNFFIPDPRRGWNKFAYARACEIIENESINHIITTSPPHSTQLIGLKISKKYSEINWIADLRDPWTEIYYYDQFYPTFISKMIDSRYEKMVLENSDKIITVGPSLRSSLSLKVKEAGEKTEIITNGYDEEDFNGKTGIIPSIFTITYVGTLSERYPVDQFLKVIGKIKKTGVEIRVRFVGAIPDNIAEKISSEISADCVEFISYTNHNEAISHMLNSSMLLLIIPEHRSNKTIITGKIFEYIAAGKPVLCLGPEDGDASSILMNSGFGKCFYYDDVINIESYILSAIANPAGVQPSSVEFTYRNITNILAHSLDSLAGSNKRYN